MIPSMASQPGPAVAKHTQPMTVPLGLTDGMIVLVWNAMQYLARHNKAFDS